jgi:hypothetical protein
MRILNADQMSNTYKCYYPLGDWLSTNFNLPPLNKDETFYYFADTKELHNLLAIQPAWVKFSNWVESKVKGG